MRAHAAIHGTTRSLTVAKRFETPARKLARRESGAGCRPGNEPSGDRHRNLFSAGIGRADAEIPLKAYPDPANREKLRDAVQDALDDAIARKKHELDRRRTARFRSRHESTVSRSIPTPWLA
ncbi:MAG: hypothetical protein IPP10_18835 [Candidatus Competibacteraceae bacterium]|nr:hypothetical protein [Candidatus Competibacteraceae bacterium]